MTEAHDTTELLHQLVAQLDRADGSADLDTAQLASLTRRLATVVDALDQRLKALEETPKPPGTPDN